MAKITPLHTLRVPLGGQEIALQEMECDAGGMRFLRTRIREKSRFTIFDIDPVTAQAWGEQLLRWAASQTPCEANSEAAERAAEKDRA